MLVVTITFFIILPVLIAANYQSKLWPIPQSVEWGSYNLELDSKFYIVGPNQPIITKAIQRYLNIILKEHWQPVQFPFREEASKQQHKHKLQSLIIQVDDEKKDIDFDVDESYSLSIPLHANAHLKSKTVWGALRGLETFSQLIQQKIHHDIDYENQHLSLRDLVIPKVPIYIDDSPAYPHRGLMLDTARNYFPVFHWHITDSQSFPIELNSIPELAKKGAYKFQGKHLVYTKENIKHIIKYAHERGIRVIPEIDMPGHTGSFAPAFKDIVTCYGMYYLDPSNSWDKRFAAEPGTGQLNPVKAKTYKVIKQVIDEINELFPDSHYHGGGDEPVYNCWDQDDTIKNYMKKENKTHDDLLYQFLSKELDIIKKNSKQTILWEDAVTNNDLPLPKDVILQVWTNPVQLAIKKGYKVIASNSNFWYLDCGHGGWGGNDTSYNEQLRPEIPDEVQQVLEKYNIADNYNPLNWGGPGGDWCSPFKTWQRVYSYDLTFNLTKEESKSVLGGEVALWSEQTDSTSLDVRLWPRTAAAAEVLWSGKENNKQRDLGNAMDRMFDWRYRLVHRGIGAEAIQPLWCGQNPHLCDATYPAVFLH
ncbi:glycoside hydrolase superfamily [Cunninghamella echinulata]|nr:glycoside hydrolase superfamily [Cunninghamella echinulata]